MLVQFQKFQCTAVWPITVYNILAVNMCQSKATCFTVLGKKRERGQSLNSSFKISGLLTLVPDLLGSVQ